MSKSALDTLGELQGLGESYYDHRGELRYFSAAAKTALLAAMSYDVHDERAIETAMRAEHRARWQTLLPAVCVVVQGQGVYCELHVPLAALADEVNWRVLCEDGSELSGVTQLGHLEVLDRSRIEDSEFLKLRLPLSEHIPLGYHQLMVALNTAAAESVTLIVTPPRCYEPEIMMQGQRLWGLAIQLYTLRSRHNWGMGDFADLRELIDLAAAQGCALVGLNPLHALRPADPAHISPYSPSSRQFLNVLYIAVPLTPEFAECAPAQRYVQSAAVQARVHALRATPNVDYPGVAELKFTVLKLLHAHFRKRHLAQDTPRAQAFRNYLEMRGETLCLQALYDALDRRFCRQAGSQWGWQSWPEAYRDPYATAPQRFLQEHAEEVEFFQYLQWLAEEQLGEVQTLACAQGMKIGIYGDVAVGVNPNGAESWANQKLYLNAVGIGAPPDPLALKGQDWGIPPQNPNALRAQAYWPFVAMLRGNMRQAGALRIDHVMALCRLWWVPRGFSATEGVYVRYPLADLMGIVALESVRNRCLVIGEDLGTVPDEMREAMERYGLYHYKVLLFEKERDGQFKMPDRYVRHALATVTTHDLPPLKSWWEAQDIALRVSLNLYPDEQARERVSAEREHDRRTLLAALVRNGLWHWEGHEALPAYSQALMRAVHLYLGLSNAALTMVQLEELLGMSDPVNVPGTDGEYPNWQRKLSDPSEVLFKRVEVHEVLNALSRARRGENPNA